MESSELQTAPPEQKSGVKQKAVAPPDHANDQSAAPFDRSFGAASRDSQNGNGVRLLRNPSLSQSANGSIRAVAFKGAQQVHGNRFVQRALAGRFIQRHCLCGGTCGKCRTEEEASPIPAVESSEESVRPVQRESADSPSARISTSAHDVMTASGGEPFDEGTRKFMESRFGIDFSDVRIHTDAPAAQSAEELNAKAYTTGRDIYFAAGKYAPATSEGQHLIAHELVHTVQQSKRITHREGPKRTHEGILVGPADDPLEREADRVAVALMAAPPTGVDPRPVGNEPWIHAVAQPDAISGAMPAIQCTPNAPEPGMDSSSVSTDKSVTSSLGTIAEDLQFDLKNKPGRREPILRNMLRAAKQRNELERLYKEKSPNKDADLNVDLKPDGAWSSRDFIRAQRYLDYGELRTVDKIYLAAKGPGTEWPTIERLLPEVNRNFTAIEAAFSLDYKDDYPKKSRLPNDQQSGIGGLIDDEFPSGNDAPEAIKGKAVIAFGEAQPIDLVRAATDADTMLRPLQQARESFESVQILQKRYQERYPESLLQKHIESKLSGDDIKRARMILDGTFTARNRIKLAMGAGIDPDEKQIWAAFQEATQAEIEELRKEYKNQGEIYKMFKGGIFTGLSKENLMRAEALLGVGPEGEEPILTKLTAQGGVNGGEIVKVIKTAVKSDWEAYRDAYKHSGGSLRKFADELLNADEKGQVASYLQDAVLDRIKYGLDHQDVEYVTLQIISFAREEDKKSILSDAALMGRIQSSFNTREANKIRDLLIPANLGPEEKAKLLSDKISRESSFVWSWTASAEALEDEQRELAIALEKAKTDGKLTPEERNRIEELNRRTEGALSAYLGVRDELNGYLETALNIAASIAVTAATGGAGAGMLAAATARAALAQGILSVAVKKIVRGDNFEVFSPEATGVFVAGFVDGAMNAVGGPAAKTAVSAALRDSARVSALETGKLVFGSSGRTILTRVAEGVISSSPGAMVGTAVDDGTWKDGFAKGFEAILQSGVQAAIVGGVVSVGAGALGDAIKLGVGADGQEHLLVFEPDGTPRRCSPNCPIFGTNVSDRLDRFQAESKLVISARLDAETKDLRKSAAILTQEAESLKNLPAFEFKQRKADLKLRAVQIEQRVTSIEKADKIFKRIYETRGPIVVNDLDVQTALMLQKVFGENLAGILHWKETIASYESLRIAVQGWEGNYQAHHIVEDQILRLLGHDVLACPAIILTKAEHDAITRRLANYLHPVDVKYMDLTKREILEAYEEAYKDHPLWLAEVKRYF